MSTVRRFVKNTVILVVAKALQPVITFYLIVTISREIGLEGFGAYSTIFKYIPIFQIIAGFGLRNLLAREIAQNKELVHKYVVAASLIGLLCGIASALAMGLMVTIMSDNPIVVYGTMLASISMVAAGVADVYEGVVSGFEELKQVGYALLAENIIRVGISLWLIYSGFGVIPVVLAFVFARFLKTIYFYNYVKRKYTNPVGTFDKQFFRDLFAQARTFALIMVCVTIFWNIDAILLESMRSAEEVGYYSAAYRFLALSMILVHSYVSSLFPVISNYFKTSRMKFEVACRKSLRILILATLPIAVSMTLLGDKVIVLLFTETFLPSVPVLQLIIWGLIPYAISQIFAYALIASNQQKIDLGVNATCMVANILLNLLLIPKFGYIGSAIAILVSIVLYISLQMPFVFQKLIKFDYRMLLSNFVRVVLAGGVMVVAIAALRELPVFVVLPLSFVVYLGGLLGLRLITKADRQMIFSMARPSAST